MDRGSLQKWVNSTLNYTKHFTELVSVKCRHVNQCRSLVLACLACWQMKTKLNDHLKLNK